MQPGTIVHCRNCDWELLPSESFRHRIAPFAGRGERSGGGNVSLADLVDDDNYRANAPPSLSITLVDFSYR